MAQVILTEDEISTAARALRVAAEKFEDYAKTEFNTRLIQQFSRQAAESRALAEKLEGDWPEEQVWRKA
jgi:hypothetical protein